MDKIRMNISNCAFIVVAFLLICTDVEVVWSQGLPYQCGEQGGGRLCDPGFCCSNWGWCGTSDYYCGQGNCQAQCPPSADITDIISHDLFEAMLPRRDTASQCRVAHGFYTYDAFVDAARSFTGFGTTGNITNRTREVAAFFAQTAATTTHFNTIEQAIGYCYKRRWGNPATFGPDCNPNIIQWPCVPGKKYYDRGPFQIRGNGVYGPCGFAIGEDLLGNPDLVETDPVISFKTAIWHWMTPGRTSSCHDVMVGKWEPTPSDIAANRLPGFGTVTNILYGSTFCGKGANPQETLRREFYLRFCRMLGVDPGENLSCTDQTPISVKLLSAVASA